MRLWVIRLRLEGYDMTRGLSVLVGKVSGCFAPRDIGSFLEGRFSAAGFVGGKI